MKESLFKEKREVSEPPELEKISIARESAHADETDSARSLPQILRTSGVFLLRLATTSSSQRRKEVQKASSLLLAEIFRATILLQHVDNISGDAPASVPSLLEDVQEDLLARLRRAQLMMKPFSHVREYESRLSLRDEFKWEMAKKNLHVELQACEKLSDTLVLHDQRQNSATLTLVLRALERNNALSSSLNEQLERHFDADQTALRPLSGDRLAGMVEAMYKLALEGLFYISRLGRDAKFDVLYEKLKGWGLGLFEDADNLTKLLAKDHVKGGRLSAFHMVFVALLLDIGTVKRGAAIPAKFVLTRSARANTRHLQAR